ncbi:restriction endonuclease subunit S [Burkholderia humptydooensis]|uniref:Restriction endonuclease subunit S n=1 Tax=Burkholderia humptydooensis TaxID=430531 RepID=A0A7T2TZB1_9BURK|nr:MULTISPECIES: restriction endonuclease subunit S [Burkholderia]AJY43541.1 type I restriction modification DNA specificity domain protein [Burkholderia sp. 2002721687]QPS42842.1 restriction endonuclease subunit S [Burkholderia humptydooensis]
MKKLSFCDKWPIKPLGKTLPIEYGKALPANLRDGSGIVPVYGSNGIAGRHSRALTSGQTLLIGRKGGAGIAHLSREACWVIDTAYYTVDDSVYDLSFACYLLQFLRLDALDKSTTIPSLSRDDYNATLAPVPTKDEQRIIVEKLDELFSDVDTGVASLSRAYGNLRRYRASVLKMALEGRLTVDWRSNNPSTSTGEQLLSRILTARRDEWEREQSERFSAQGKRPPKNWRDKYAEPAGPDVKNLPELPAGWCWATLQQLTGTITSGSRGWAKYYSNDGPIFIRSQDINTDLLNIDSVAHVNPPKDSEGGRTLVRLGDLLITITGANVAKCAEVTCHIDEAYVSQHVALARPVLPEISRYLHACLTCESQGRRQLLKFAYGAGKPGLNLQQVASVVVPLPTFSEQSQIVQLIDEQLAAHTRIEGQLEHDVVRARQLRQSILKAAFEGKLTSAEHLIDCTEQAA